MNTSIDNWKTTKWKDINVEQMDIDCKKFAKDVRSLDKEMKSWDAFVGLDSTVKSMIASLRAASELQNPAIRDRHWQQLMQATQVPALAAGRPRVGGKASLAEGAPPRHRASRWRHRLPPAPSGARSSHHPASLQRTELSVRRR